MFSIPEQFSAATKTQLEAQFTILNTLASTAVESAEKVIALNLSTTKDTVGLSSAAARQLLEDPQEFFQHNSSQPANFDRLFAYGRQLFSIATAAQSELIKTTQAQLKAASSAASAAAAPASAPKGIAKLTSVAKPVIVAAVVTPANEASADAPVASAAATITAAPAAPKAAKAAGKAKPAAAKAAPPPFPSVPKTKK